MNTFAYYHFAHAGKNHMTLGSEIEDLITYSTANSMSIVFVSVLQGPQIPRGQFQGARVDTLHTRVPLKLRNPELGEPACFMANLLAVEGDVI